MYVDPFWAGVFATLFVEAVLFAVTPFIMFCSQTIKRNNGGNQYV